jgi:AraC-like DNA-binding protein
MVEKRASVPINYLRQVADQLADLGADTIAWLASVPLRETDLADPERSIPTETFGALMDDAIARAGETGFGLLVGRRLMPSTHGIVGMAASASASIREAMEIAEQFIALRTGVVDIQTRVAGDVFEVVFEAAPALGRSAGAAVTEAAVLAVKNIADEKTLASACRSVSFAFAQPPHAALARQILGCEIRYGQTWSGLSFPRALAEQIVPRRDALVLAEALRICGSEMKNLHQDHSVGSKLERLILERKPTFPALELCARLLGMTPRTLHRRLADEGTSYSEVLDSVKHRIAQECLRVERLSVKEVAYLLGYNDVANFRRAFKRWEGVPPSRH